MGAEPGLAHPATDRRPSRKMFDLSLRFPGDGPRGPAALNLVRFLRAPDRYAMRVARQYGDRGVVPVTRGNGAVLLAFGPEAVRQVFTETDTFHRAGGGVLRLAPGRPWSQMFDNVITANGQDHRRRRKLLLPVTHRSALAHYEQIFHDTFERSRFADSTNDEPFDIVAEFAAMSQRNLLLGLLGLPDTPTNRALASAVVGLTTRLSRPQVLLFPFDQPWTPYGRWLRSVADCYERIAALIDERRADPRERLDALSLICATTDESGDRLSTPELAGEVNGFFGAGFETTALTMTWALVTMLAAPAAADLDATDPAIVDAIVKESQRLLPVVPVSLPRRATVETSIAGSPPVPATAVVWLSALVEHHRAEVYPEPYAFRPQRWLSGEQPGPHAFFPFGIGARRCLGASFADLQVRVTLRRIAAGRPLRLVTNHIDYHLRSAAAGAPRQPILVQFADNREKPPRLTGSIRELWWED